MVSPLLKWGHKFMVSPLLLIAAACATPPPPPPPPPEPKPVAIIPAAPKEPTAEMRFNMGSEALKAREYAAAVESFGIAVKKNDTMWAAWFNKALAQEGVPDLDGAEKSYLEVRKLKPDHRGALLNLGRLYRLREDYQKAIALYQKELEKDPYDVQLLNNVVVCLRLAKKYKEAEETVRRLLARAPRNADAYKNLSLIYYDQGKLRLAEFINGNAKKLDDKDPGIYNNLGMIYQQRGELTLALGQFKKAIELNPNFVPGLMNIGAIALKYRDYKLAEETFAKVLTMNPGDYQAHLFYAFSLEGRKKGKEAVDEYQKVLAIKKEHPDAVFGLANCYFRLLNDAPKGLEIYKRYVGMPEAAAAQKAVAEKNITTIENRLKAKAAQKQQIEEEEKKAPPPVPTGPSIIEQQTETPEGEAPAAEGAPAPTPAIPAEGVSPAAPPEGAPAPPAPVPAAGDGVSDSAAGAPGGAAPVAADAAKAQAQ